MNMKPQSLVIREVGPRDGLQNEATQLRPGMRAELINRLLNAGIRRVEAVSFVHPQLVPSMSEAEEVMRLVRQIPGRVISGLVLNQRGFDRAIAASVDHINYSFAVTDSFAQRNQNATTEQAIKLARQLI
ncbi:MAG: hydroxymethylglutaryl-CoA lyase, partial [Candidatus Dormibacteraceae bacterium]